ncbi:MAG: N-terminal acetyltransferase [Peltula sp. TS41687]|nr:MAG: N-terminal acetyltransferase [Peltula sp. TS41687]
MSALRPFHALDLLKFNHTNLDNLTENYDITYYLTYLARWPSLINVIEGPKGEINAYRQSKVMGKLESSPHIYRHTSHYLPWHAHITALTVAPSARRLGLARRLSKTLEKAGDEFNAWFVDLFVRESNKVAIEMYRGMGYSVYRRVVGYYSDDPSGRDRKDGEDAFDMRKPLERDKFREHIREKGEDVRVYAQDVW